VCCIRLARGLEMMARFVKEEKSKYLMVNFIYI
jgi:hypothetical protein